MYVLVYEVEGSYGGRYEDTLEFADMSILVKYLLNNPLTDPLCAYEVTKPKITSAQLDDMVADVRFAENKAREAALAKLTPVERDLLGVA